MSGTVELLIGPPPGSKCLLFPGIRFPALLARRIFSSTMTGMLKLRAQRRDSPSSITAQAPGSDFASERTADSPAPRSQAAISVAIFGPVTRLIQSLSRIALTVGSSGP